MNSEILKWLVFRISVTGFDGDALEDTILLESFHLFEQAESFVNDFKMNAYDKRLIIVRGKIKN